MATINAMRYLKRFTYINVHPIAAQVVIWKEHYLVIRPDGSRVMVKAMLHKPSRKCVLCVLSCVLTVCRVTTPFMSFMFRSMRRPSYSSHAHSKAKPTPPARATITVIEGCRGWSHR